MKGGRISCCRELYKLLIEGEGKDGGKEVLENILEEGKEKERRREEILREFSPAEREVLTTVPAADNIDDLARY